MLLSSVVSHFSEQEFRDAYTGSFVFRGKLDSYNGSVRDSLTGGRRTVSIPVKYSKPDRNVVTFSGCAYLTGDIVGDYTNGRELKKHIILHPADGLAYIGSSANIITDVGLTEVFVGISWRKSQKEESESSELFNLVNIYLGAGEIWSRNSVVLLNGRYYRVQGIEDTTGGFIILVASELEADVVQTVSYTPASGTYDPVTDTKATSASFSIQALVERSQTTYRYTNTSNEKFKPGDLVVTFTNSDVADPLPGDKIAVGSTEYVLLSAIDDGVGSWESHLRLN